MYGYRNTVHATYFDAHGERFSQYHGRNISESRFVGASRGAVGMIVDSGYGRRYFIRGGKANRWYERNADDWAKWIGEEYE